MKLELNKRPTLILIVGLFGLAVSINLYFVTRKWPPLFGTPRASAEQQSGAKTPYTHYEFPISHDWTLPLMFEIEDKWTYRTDPPDAILEVRNASKPQQILRLAGAKTLPGSWRQTQWRIAPDEKREVMLFLARDIPPDAAIASPSPPTTVAPTPVVTNRQNVATPPPPKQENSQPSFERPWPYGAKPTREYTVARDLNFNPTTDGTYRWIETIRKGDDLQINLAPQWSLTWDMPEGTEILLKQASGDWITPTPVSSSSGIRVRLKPGNSDSAQLNLSVKPMSPNR